MTDQISLLLPRPRNLGCGRYCEVAIATELVVMLVVGSSSFACSQASAKIEGDDYENPISNDRRRRSTFGATRLNLFPCGTGE
jgi:hypothetical protein